jgi:hypothetical protein
MPWIEGIGDEVTIGVSVLFGLCILFVAWLSTGKLCPVSFVIIDISDNNYGSELIYLGSEITDIYMK